MQRETKGYGLQIGLIVFVLFVLLSGVVRHEAEKLGGSVQNKVHEAVTTKVEQILDLPGEGDVTDIDSIQWK